MIEHIVDINTPDGVMPTIVFHPEHDGPHPVVLYLMDAPSIRPATSVVSRNWVAARISSSEPFLLLCSNENENASGRSDVSAASLP